MCTSGWSKHSRDIEALRDATRNMGNQLAEHSIKEMLAEDPIAMEGLIDAALEVFSSGGYRGGPDVNTAIEVAIDQHYRRRAAA